MRAGIIAAGLGERFRNAGIATPKPLIAVAGKTLLERTIACVAEAGARSVALIVNAEYPAVERYVRERSWPVPLDLTVRTTPSSMESFFALEPSLRDSPFLLTTVDAIAARGTLSGLAAAGAAAGPLGTLAVTRWVDDEKPLWVKLDADQRIGEIGAAALGSGWVTSGAYFFFPGVYDYVAEARRRGCTALREFLGLLVGEDGGLRGFAAGDSIDVDRPEDLAAAERFLAAHEER